MQHPLVTASFYMKNIEKLDLFFRKGGAVFSRNTQLQLCNSGYEFRPGRTQGKPAKSNFSAQRQKKKHGRTTREMQNGEIADVEISVFTRLAW